MEMQRKVNIQSLLQARDSLTKDSFVGLLGHYGIAVKDEELGDIGGLVEMLRGAGCNIGSLDGFYVGYKIPQIGKEFDLLRFGAKSIMNVEVKSDCSEDKIKKQLVRNRYYLSFLGRRVWTLTFVSKSRRLYSLRNDGELEVVEISNLSDLLSNQDLDVSANPDSLFDPSAYLVSPFNSTSRFLEGEYFLTQQQEDVRAKVLGSISTRQGTAPLFSVSGAAGTGKTLLVFDIAKSLMSNGCSVLIIHCGRMNEGHFKLVEAGWLIDSIKNYEKYDLSSYDAVFVDEAQRIDPNQLDSIIKMAKAGDCCCVFSYDRHQTLAHWEERRNISGKIESIPKISTYRLSEKIRTNKEISSFVKMLFDRNRREAVSGNDSVVMSYFSSIDDAKNYLEGVAEQGCEILRFTPSQYNQEYHEKYSDLSRSTSHRVIGQEFDSVAVTIDQFFSYDKSGKLAYVGKTYYDPVKMLFQNITRARKKIHVVIIGNQELLNRCVSILQK